MVRTDHRASPTGFPFKVVELEGTVGMKDTYQARPRLCDLGYLRSHTITTEGKTISKCAAEPDAPYLKKGATTEDIDKMITKFPKGRTAKELD